MESKVLVGYNQLLTATHIAEHVEFNLPVFEDFNRFVESAILYDKVVLLGDYEISGSNFIDELSRAGIFDTLSQNRIHKLADSSKEVQANYGRSMQQIFGESVLQQTEASPGDIIRLRLNPNLFAQRFMDTFFFKVIECTTGQNFNIKGFRHWLNRELLPTKDFGGHFYYFARSIIYSAIAESLDMDYTPDMLRTPLAALAFTQRPNSISRQLFSEMSDKFREEIEALVLLGMPSQVFIPPLTAKILSQASRPEDYAAEILALRRKFASYRKTYVEFMELLRDPDVPISKKLREKKHLNDSIKSIIDRGGSDHAINIRAVFERFLSSDLDDEGASASLSISGLVSVMLEQIQEWRIRGRARALFDLWSDTKNLKNYGSLIEDAFQTQINPTEIERLKNYSAAIKSIMRFSST